MMENNIQKISVYGDSILKGAVTGTGSGHLFDIIEENSLALASRALGVSVEYLVTGETEKTPQIPAETRFVAETFNTLSENDKKSVIALLKEMKSHR